MTTIVSILMSDVVPLRERGTWQGILNIVFASGAACGAPLGMSRLIPNSPLSIIASTSNSQFRWYTIRLYRLAMVSGSVRSKPQIN